MTLRIFVDLVGIYYCNKCVNDLKTLINCIVRYIRSYLKNVVSKRGKNDGKVVGLWDKNVDFPEKDKVLGIIMQSIGHLYLKKEYCEGSDKNCQLVSCNLHKSYCCICNAQKGDIVISIVKGSKVTCAPQGYISFSDGIALDNQEINDPCSHPCPLAIILL